MRAKHELRVAADLVEAVAQREQLSRERRVAPIAEALRVGAEAVDLEAELTSEPANRVAEGAVLAHRRCSPWRTSRTATGELFSCLSRVARATPLTAVGRGGERLLTAV